AGVDRAPGQEGGDPSLERARSVRRAGQMAQTQEHLTLPLAPAQLIAAERSLAAAHERTRAALRPEVHVPAVDDSVFGTLLEAALELADHRRRGLTRRVTAFVRRSLAHEEQIDVGGEVELATAQLAERK